MINTLIIFRTPQNLTIVLSRRSRRVESQTLPWEQKMSNHLKGVVVWAIPENKEFTVTLFKDPRTLELEDKDWIISVESVCIFSIKRLI